MTQKYFFSADWHIGHRNILKLCNRPYANLGEMYEAFIDITNQHVSVRDTLYLLGDTSFLKPERTWPILDKLKVKDIRLVRGNHDHKKLVGNDRSYEEFSFDGRKIVLCHYPIESWNGMHRGAIMLHGHSHGKLQRKMNNRFDVGWDVWGAPVSLDMLIKEHCVDFNPRPEGAGNDYNL